jgi:hypothetical protein
MLGLPSTRSGFVAMVLALSFVLAGPEPAVAEQGRAKLTASGGAAEEIFGRNVAIDGDVVVVGTSGIDVDGNTDQGTAFVYVRPPGGWSGRFTEVARLTAANGEPFLRLDAVAIDGDVIVVGAHSADVRERDQGAAYVFVKPPGGWAGNLTESARLVASDGEFMDNLGSSVAISGGTIVVGAFADDVGPNLRQGSAYVFVEPHGGWAGELTETAKLVASDGEAHDNAGLAVGIDGATAVLGSHQHTIDGGTQGALYVFVEPPGGWGGLLTETAKLTASDATPGALLGLSLSIVADTIVAGAPGDTVGGNSRQGSAYVFLEPPGGWGGELTESAKLTASDGETEDFFGGSVSTDGATVIAGAYFDYVGGVQHQGSAYVFGEPPGGWAGPLNERARLVAADGAALDLFGYSVAVEGGTFIAGAAGDDVGGDVDQGSAYVFERQREARP